jgi:hypothetical protein
MLQRYLKQQKAQLVQFRTPNHPGATRNAQLDSGSLQQQQQQQQGALNQAAAAEGDRWMPYDSPESDRPNQQQQQQQMRPSYEVAGRHRQLSSPIRHPFSAYGREDESQKSPKEHGCAGYTMRSSIRGRSASRSRSRDRGSSPADRQQQQQRSRSRSRSRIVSPSPSTAAAAAAAAGVRPSAAAAAAAAAGVQAVRTWSWSRLDLSGLRNAERDEVRSLALLHSFAAAAAAKPTKHSSSSSSLSLELAAEPQEVLNASVSVEELSLPAQMVPSNCSLARFVRSYRCGLLVKNKDSDKAWVSGCHKAVQLLVKRMSGGRIFCVHATCLCT